MEKWGAYLPPAAPGGLAEDMVRIWGEGGRDGRGYCVEGWRGNGRKVEGRCGSVEERCGSVEERCGMAEGD